MDKIILKDGSIVEIKESSNGDSFCKTFTDPQEYLTTLAKLTQDNLSAYQVQNSAGLTCANPVNKECLTQNVTALRSEDGILTGLDVTFNITDVDMLAKAVKDIQAGQQTQDGAIADMGETIGKIAEGGLK
ncbi:MAG: hypothetical protein E7250_05470 [Paenibacillaceae bacterium]|nr:hypothetical protein [Paenibacillaceae bacterium]